MADVLLVVDNSIQMSEVFTKKELGVDLICPRRFNPWEMSRFRYISATLGL